MNIGFLGRGIELIWFDLVECINFSNNQKKNLIEFFIYTQINQVHTKNTKNTNSHKFLFHFRNMMMMVNK